MKEAKNSSSCTPILQRVFPIPSGSSNQDYSCTYPLGIEHVGMVEKGRGRDRERDQGQPEARAPNGHHRDYILLLFVGLARKSTLVCFLFLFK